MLEGGGGGNGLNGGEAGCAAARGSYVYTHKTTGICSYSTLTHDDPTVVSYSSSSKVPIGGNRLTQIECFVVSVFKVLLWPQVHPPPIVTVATTLQHLGRGGLIRLLVLLRVQGRVMLLLLGLALLPLNVELVDDLIKVDLRVTHRIQVQCRLRCGVLRPLPPLLLAVLLWAVRRLTKLVPLRTPEVTVRARFEVGQRLGANADLQLRRRGA